MVSVRFCCRSADGVGKETVQLPPSCLTQPVQAVRSTAAHMLGLTPSQLELVYRGRPLLDDRLLSSYELSAASVLHGFRRPADADTAAAAAPTEPADGTQLAWTLQRHTQDPVRRHAFTQRLVRPETLDRLLAAVPGLEDDPIALALLQEPGLLLQVASPRTNVKRLVAAHPVLATAASQLASLLGEGSSGTERGRPGPSDSRAAPRVAEERPMEQGSFDDDDGDDEPAAAAGGAAAPPITREQLASALAAAVPNLASAAAAAAQGSGASGGAGGQTRTPAAVRQQPAPAPAPAPTSAPAPVSTPAPAQQQPLGVISPEMVSAALREAMRALPGAQRTPPAAQAAQPQPPPSAAAPVPQPAAPVREEAAHQSPAVDEAAVRQLLELGITDSEALVRQALLVSEGNIDHAVEFIYSSLQ